MIRKVAILLLALGISVPAMASGFSISAALNTSPLGQNFAGEVGVGYEATDFSITAALHTAPLGQNLHADLGLKWQTNLTSSIVAGVWADAESNFSSFDANLNPWIEYKMSLAKSATSDVSAYVGVEAYLGFGSATTTNADVYVGADATFTVAKGIDFSAGVFATYQLLNNSGLAADGYVGLDFDLSPATVYAHVDLGLAPTFSYRAHAGVDYALSSSTSLSAEVGYDGDLDAMVGVKIGF